MTRSIRLSIALAVVLASACTGRGCGAGPASRGALTLATTTSVGNSGLLDALLVPYGESARIDVRPLLVGSGLALKMLADGHADLVISHSPMAEQAALRDHPLWTYRKLMFNDFVLVGPVDDPAKVAGAASLIDAMRRIAASPSRFISRGDQSGTHEREQLLWARAGVSPAPERLIVAGAGMGSTLRVASETGAYTLADRATYSQLASSLGLTVRFEGGTLLLNTYSVVFDPAGARAREAAALAEWLSDGDGRRRIERYRVAGDVPAFRVWPEGRPRTRPQDGPF